MRPVRHVSRLMAAITIAATMVVYGGGTADASHNGTAGHTEISTLIADLAEANQRLADIGAEIRAQQEGVNKALVDVANAREAATSARRDVEVSSQALADTNTAIAAAQRRFDEFAAATYI